MEVVDISTVVLSCVLGYKKKKVLCILSKKQVVFSYISDQLPCIYAPKFSLYKLHSYL